MYLLQHWVKLQNPTHLQLGVELQSRTLFYVFDTTMSCRNPVFAAATELGEHINDTVLDMETELGMLHRT